MSPLLRKYPYKGEPWDTPPKDPSRRQIHKLVVATGEIGEPAVRKVVEYLEKYPDELEATDRAKWTPLHWAVETSTPETVQLLIDYGANIDARSKWESTPLLLAADRHEIEMCKILIDAGADLTIVNTDGYNIFHNVKRNGQHQLLELLNNAPNNPIRAKAIERRNNPYQEEEPDYMTVDI